MLKKINWDYLVSNHRNPSQEPTIRTQFVENKYIIFKFLLKNKFKMTNIEYIRQTIINSEKNKLNRFILTDNAFSYNLEDGIRHLLLWVNPSHKDNKILYQNQVNLNKCDWLYNHIYNKLSQKYSLKKYEYVYFENHKNNRSIPEIKHIHIFVKLKKIFLVDQLE